MMPPDGTKPKRRIRRDLGVPKAQDDDAPHP